MSANVFLQSISCAGKLGFMKTGEIIWHFKPAHFFFQALQLKRLSEIPAGFCEIDI